MTHGRKRLRTIMFGLAAVITVGLVPATPTYADPSIKEVQARVDALYGDAERAQEHFNDLQLQLKHLRSDLSALQADERRQEQRFSLIRTQVQDALVSQYQGEDLSTVSQVVVSDDPGQFLGQLSTMSAVTDLQASLYDDYATELKALDIRHEATAKRLTEISSAERRAAADKKTVDDKLAQAKTLLDKLKAEERAKLMSGSSQAVPSDVPASGRAAAAVHYAMAQVGDAYVYGATGPGAYDCSGLTMMAWAQAGVSLPHSSSSQYGSGPHVAASDLRPGDLVFYYSPIHHVGMYIGNGLIVHAANPGAGVLVAGLYSMPYAGAVRPG